MSAQERDGAELALPEPYEPDWSVLRSTDHEPPFIEAGVELLKEATSLGLLAAGVTTAQPFARDDAIRCALLVRAGKLGRSMVIDACVGDGQQQMALSRQLMDTVATLLHLVADADGSQHTAFVNDSLIAEREFLANIKSRQKSTGDPWPIETRIERSIGRTAKAAGVDLSTLPGRSKIGWASAAERSKLLGPGSYQAYRMGSGALHGSWDLLRNHLEEVEGGFVPNFQVGPARPQPLLMGALLIIEATGAYLLRRPDHEREAFESSLDALRNRLREVDKLHESYLQRPWLLQGLDVQIESDRLAQER